MSVFGTMKNLALGNQGQSDVRACNCIGPQRGEPRCPCQMRGVIERDGRWIVPEQDLGPVRSQTPNPPIGFTRPTPTDTGGR
jgi:hypothetical protein